MKRLAGYLPILLAVLLAILLTANLYASGKGLVAAALLGSAYAVMSVWIAFFLMYRAIMFMTRGAPFNVGDFVRVTVGKHAGKVGRVTKLVDQFPAVIVRLVTEGADDEEQYFKWNQVTRWGIKRNGQEKSGSERMSAVSRI